MKRKLQLVGGLLALMLGSSAHAQYCSPSGGAYGCNDGDYISNVVMGSINNPTGCNNYGNFVAQSTTLDLGSTTNISVSLNPDYEQGIGVFIDWNQDFDFTDAGEFFSTGSITNYASTATIPITVPAGATPGTTRMRVMCQYNNVAGAGNSCNTSGNYGEFEDYSLVIRNKLPYSAGNSNNGWQNPTLTMNNFSTCQTTASLSASCGVYNGFSWGNGNCVVFVNGINIGTFNGNHVYDLTPYIPITSVFLDPTETFNYTTMGATVEIISNSTSTPTMPTASNVTYCQNETPAQLSATLTGTGTTLKWFTGSLGEGYSATAPTPSTSTVGTVSYYVSEAEAGGCESPRRKIDVTVNALPTAPGASNQSFCNGAVVSNLVPAQSSTYHWYNTAGTSTELAGGTSLVQGNYYVSQTNGAGCSSSKTSIAVNFLNNTGTDLQTACASYDWIDGNTYTSSNNTATHILTNAAGCDSVVTLNLTILTPTTGTDVQSACESYNWIDGNTYTSSNNSATYMLTNAAGCDSVVTLNLTILTPTTGTDVQSACESYDWMDGNTYTSSNSTATYMLTNAAGCDSLVTLNLTILTPTTGTDVQSACDSYDWIDGNTYTSSNNTATYMLTNEAGCDSVVTLNLTILTPTTGIDIQSACDSYDWMDGNTYTSSNNTATYMLTNAAGCDSVVTLNLTIHANPTAVATDNGDGTISAASATTYQWMNCSTGNPIVGATAQTFAPTTNGDYSVVVTNANGCSDESSCINIDYLAIEELANVQVEVYPNPTSNVFTVVTNIEPLTFTLSDAKGSVVLKGSLESGKTIDVSNYETGVYFLSIIHTNGTIVKRVVKQ